MDNGFQNIRNVYCVGRNYRLHAAELGNEVPDKPMLFMKPTHALAALDGGELILPGDAGEVHHEVECVVRIGEGYRPGTAPGQAIDGFALGLDFTLRDVQSELKKKGHPWLAAKGFPRSAGLTAFIPYPGDEAFAGGTFTLRRGDHTLQTGRPQDMLFSLRDLLRYCDRHFGLGPGDILFTGTPAGVGAVADGDRLTLAWNGETLGSCVVRLHA